MFQRFLFPFLRRFSWLGLFALSGALSVCGPLPALGQGNVTSTGTFVPGHALRSNTVSGSPLSDSGGSAGALKGTSNYFTELGITNSGNGTPFCINDNFIDNPGGYHAFCLGPNGGGVGALLSYNAVGAASPLPVFWNINGTTYQFPFILSGIAGPGISTIGDLPTFGNTQGTLLNDSGIPLTGIENNTVNSQPGNYTVATTDCGKTIAASGPFGTITLPAVTGFPTNCAITVRNTNTTRAQKLVGFPASWSIPNVNCGGTNNACLFPTQTIQVKIVSGAWLTWHQQGRWQTLTPTFLVDPTGSDTNDCLGSGVNACATIQHAADLACFTVDAGNQNVNVQLAHGTYTNGAQVVTHCLSQNSVAITGDTSAQSAVIVTQSAATQMFYAKDKGFIVLSGMTLQPTAALVTPIACGQHSNFDVSFVTFNNTPSSPLVAASDNCTVNLLNNIQIVDNISGSSASSFLSATGAARILVNTNITVTGTWTVTYGCVAQDLGVIIFNNTAFTGGTVTGQKFLANLGGVITGLFPFTSCPGSTGGVSTNSTLSGNPGNPTGTSSATFVQMGLGGTCTITPIKSTALNVQFTGTLLNNTAADGAAVVASIGTGAAPGNGVAFTGGEIGQPVNLIAPPSGLQVPFTTGGVITAIVPGTAYWIDLQLERVTGGTASVQSVTCSANEVN